MSKALDSFMIVGFIRVPNAHIEVGINLFPYPLKSLTNFNKVSKHLLCYFIQTDVLTDVDYSPKQIPIRFFKLLSQIARVGLHLVCNHYHRLHQLLSHTR